MSFLCCLTMSMLGLAWSDDLGPAPKPEPTAAANCLTKPISCCFKDVSLQEACEWFEYLMCVKITIDEDAMHHARGDEGRHTALEVEDMPFEEVLNKLLKPMGLTYGVNEKGIQITIGTVVTPTPATEEDEDWPDSYYEGLDDEDEDVPYSEEEPAKEETQSINWCDDYQAARKQAEKEGMPLLIHFYYENSYYSEKFDEKIFRDPKVAATIVGNFIALKIYPDKEVKITDQYGVSQYPATILESPDGKICETIIGFVEAPAFLEKLQRVLHDNKPKNEQPATEEDENVPYSEEEPAKEEQQEFEEAAPSPGYLPGPLGHPHIGPYHQVENPICAMEIERRLNKSISVSSEKTPLNTVCRDLQRMSGINIVLDKAALEEANYDFDGPLSLSVENISLKSVLNLLLREIHLTYEIKDDAIVITVEPRSGGFLQARYPVAKYLQGPKSEKSIDQLIKLITNTIAPESWESMGGPGKIQYFPNEKQLVIGQQTQDVHEQIEELFAALDRSKPCTEEELKDLRTYESMQTPWPANLKGLVVGLCTSQPQFQVVFPVADLVIPADAVTPVVCKMLNKPFQPTAKDGNRTTIEGELIELITSKIDPDSWESAGGYGRIQYFPLGMSLVVVNTKEVQKKVADLLNNIRKLQDKQDKEYVLEMKLMAAKGDGDPEALALPKVTMMQGRWFTMFQGKTVTLKDGSIQDLLANGPDKGQVSLTVDTQPQTKKTRQTEDDVMVGVIIRARVTTLQAKLVRLDLIIQKNELDSASRDDIVVVGNSVRSAQRIPTGEAFNHILEEDEDGTPLVWLEVRVTAVPAATDETFRGTNEPIPPTNAKPAGSPK